jgi:hypothetical protein
MRGWKRRLCHARHPAVMGSCPRAPGRSETIRLHLSIGVKDYDSPDPSAFPRMKKGAATTAPFSIEARSGGAG